MTAYRRAGRKVERRFAIGVVGVVAALALVVMLAERGSFRRFSRGGFVAALPSLTVGDNSSDQMPVVTSVRSGGVAARAGDEVIQLLGVRVKVLGRLLPGLDRGLGQALPSRRRTHPRPPRQLPDRRSVLGNECAQVLEIRLVHRPDYFTFSNSPVSMSLLTLTLISCSVVVGSTRRNSIARRRLNLKISRT